MTEFNEHFHRMLRQTEFSFVDKQAGYGGKLARQILQGMGMTSMQVSALCKERGGDDFNLAYVNETYLSPRLAVESRKLRKPVTLDTILKGLKGRAEWFTAFQDAQQNWPDNEAVAVVFDWHGDKIPDLVVHNSETLAGLSAGEWSLRFWTNDTGPYFIQPWAGFLRTLGSAMPL